MSRHKVHIKRDSLNVIMFVFCKLCMFDSLCLNHELTLEGAIGYFNALLNIPWACSSITTSSACV